MAQSITPYKGPKDPYEWIPENCPLVDDEYYFNVKYEDAPGGWIGTAMCGTKIFYGHNRQTRIFGKQLKLGL